MSKQSLVVDLIDGAIAGAVATWLMGQVTTILYERESKAVRQREDDARHGQTAYGVAAKKAAAIVGAELTDDQREKYGQAIHWALGVGAGAAYGVLRPRIKALSAGGGLLFGTAFWLFIDEGANTALGLTPGPTAFPWQTHARGLVGHFVFGAAANTMLSTIQPGA